MRAPLAALLCIVALLCVLLSAASNDPAAFYNVAREAGLTAAFPNGGSTSKQFILETTGSGVAFIDYDNDGLPDIFVVSGTRICPAACITMRAQANSRDVTGWLWA